MSANTTTPSRPSTSLPSDVANARKDRTTASILSQLHSSSPRTNVISFQGVGLYTHVEVSAPQTKPHPPNEVPETHLEFVPLGGPNRVQRRGRSRFELPDEVLSAYNKLSRILQQEEIYKCGKERIDPRMRLQCLGLPDIMVLLPPATTPPPPSPLTIAPPPPRESSEKSTTSPQDDVSMDISPDEETALRPLRLLKPIAPRCCKCHKTFYTTRSLVSHFINTHGDELDKVFFECCRHKAYTATSPTFPHTRDAHGWDARPFECPTCPLKFPDIPSVRDHFNDTHTHAAPSKTSPSLPTAPKPQSPKANSNPTPTPNPNPTPAPPPQPQFSPPEIRCLACSTTHTTIHALTAHLVQSHLGAFPKIYFSCCDLHGISQSTFLKHRGQVHGSDDQLPCPLCPQTLARMPDFAHHVNATHPRCRECETRYASPAKLAVHDCAAVQRAAKQTLEASKAASDAGPVDMSDGEIPAPAPAPAPNKDVTMGGTGDSGGSEIWGNKRDLDPRLKGR